MVIIYIHAGLMVTGFLLFFSGFVTARYLKSRRWWLKTHRAFGICGTTCTILGFFAAALHLFIAGRPHFTAPHAYLGLVIFILALIMPVMGFMQLQVQGAAKLRAIHRPLGWIMLIMVAMNIALGMYMAGII